MPEYRPYVAALSRLLPLPDGNAGKTGACQNQGQPDTATSQVHTGYKLGTNRAQALSMRIFCGFRLGRKAGILLRKSELYWRVTETINTVLFSRKSKTHVNPA